MKSVGDAVKFDEVVHVVEVPVDVGQVPGEVVVGDSCGGHELGEGLPPAERFDGVRGEVIEGVPRVGVTGPILRRDVGVVNASVFEAQVGGEPGAVFEERADDAEFVFGVWEALQDAEDSVFGLRARRGVKGAPLGAGLLFGVVVVFGGHGDRSSFR